MFFRLSKEPAVTAFGVPAVAERTIATDRRFFPKGSLAFLYFNHPATDSSKEGVNTGRFVFDDDVGGAIKGSVELTFISERANSSLPGWTNQTS